MVLSSSANDLIGVIHVVMELGTSFVGPIFAAWIMKKTKWLEFFLYPK